MNVWLSELMGEYISVCLSERKGERKSERMDESLRVFVGRYINKCCCLGRWINK